MAINCTFGDTVSVTTTGPFLLLPPVPRWFPPVSSRRGQPNRPGRQEFARCAAGGEDRDDIAVTPESTTLDVEYDIL
ncbi:hypothetical protein [Gandjariella thermophila]|uniref:hypothetical protein n=1 Tax=Gandjariella thermophila TaxID=1931992 RepID=UPI001864A572|nr:hypothetical protein [Gandjariella thermophila]